MNDRIPNTNDPNLGGLIAKIRESDGGLASAASPVIVPVKPEGEICDCFISVNKKVQKDGGSRILGWELRDEDFIMIAEFHAVWKSPTGELLDITPKGVLLPGGGGITISIDKIMFVAAPNAKYEDKQVQSINININENPLVDDFIDCQQCLFNIQNKGARAFQHGLMEFSGQEAADVGNLQVILQKLDTMFRGGKQSRNSPCFCGKGEKYKHCHGKLLRQIAKRAVQK